MSNMVRGAAVVALLCCPLTGFAYGWRSTTRQTTAYYYPVPVMYQLVVPVLPLPPCPVVVVPPPPVFQAPLVPAPVPRPLATPVPAPPSSAPIVPPVQVTPPMTQAPAVSESRSFYPAAAIRESSDRTSGDKVKVGFRNVSNRDVLLRVDGQTYLVGQGQSRTLEVGRTFLWQDGNYEVQVERVPASAPSMEIVIRR